MADKNMKAKITVDFEENPIRESLNSGETVNTLFGKIKKFFTDLKAVAFSGSYNDLSNKPSIPTKTSELTNDSGFKTTDNNTTYALSKLGSTITLTGSDGKATSVTDNNISLGETSTTAYYGDKGKIAYDHSQEAHAKVDATKVETSNTNGNIKIDGVETPVYVHPEGTNPHGTTKSDIGLGNVGNFKAVSTVANQGLSSVEKTNARTNIGLNNAIISGSQTTTSSADGGNNVYTFTDASGNTSTITVKNGSKGSTGERGASGTNGKDGISVSISSTSITYQVSSSGTVIPTGTWSTSIPSTSAGQYLWVRTIVNYSNGLSTTAYSVSRNGENGAVGAKGDKGDKGDTGTTPTIKAAGGVNIGSVGTPTVTASTSGTTTTFTFNNLKGAKGDKGDNATTTATATQSTNGLMSASDKKKLDGIATGATKLGLGETSTTAYRGDRGKIAYDHSQADHAPANAEPNQNAFSNVVANGTTVSAGNATDTLTLEAGNNITITPNSTDNKITISSDAINDNLLINPDFKINQRGISGTFSETGKYFVDRWRLESGSVTINSDGSLTLNGTIVQVFENAVGANVTASSDGGTASYDNNTKTFTLTGANDVIRWAKLEYGDTATAFAPPEPATELLKCQRYYQKYYATDMPYATSIGSGNYVIFKNVPSMRAYPTVNFHFVFGGSPVLTDTNNASHNASFSVSNYRSDNLLRIVVTSDAATDLAYIPDSFNSYCELDSEIY